MSKTLMLVDGHSMAFRAFYALPTDNFSTTSGQHTNAVYGFLSMFAKLMEEEGPTHVAVAFDLSRQSFRTERFPQYKAQREKAPEEFGGQVGLIKSVLHDMGVVTIEKENYEADDIIATLATEAKPAGFETLIVTGDRDSFQLVNDTTTVLYPMRGVSTLHRFTPEAVEEKYGLTPAQYADFAALRGDPSDNLPGIPGVGEKTATKWIQQFGSLEQLIARNDELRGKAAQSFRDRISDVEMNRYLTEMVKDLDLPYGPDETGLRAADAPAVAARFDELEFGDSLRRRVLAAVGADDATAGADGEGRGTGDDGVDVVKLGDGDLADFLGSLDGPVAVHRDEGRLALAARGDEGVRGALIDPTDLDAGDDDALRAFLSDAGRPKVVHDLKALLRDLWDHGYAPPADAAPGEWDTVAGVAHDTFLGAYLLRPSQRTYTLDNVVLAHLGRSLPAAAEGDGQLVLLDDASSDADAERAIATAAALLELAAWLHRELDANGLYPVYADIELPLAPVLARMERIGIAVDVDALEGLRDDFADRTAAAETSARELVDRPDLNLASPKQLQAVLFDQLGMPKTKKTKTGYTTAAKAIEDLAKKSPHPFLDRLLEFREFQKMKSTVEGLIKAVADDGRIHTTFNQTVAATGRLSSTEPNLQNIPVRTEFGRRIRRAFTVGDGFATLVTADYSQIEMRVMAHLSGDEGLIEAYRAGEDLHNYVGSRVFNVPIDGVTPELRRRVKAMSYGLAYGLSEFGLAAQLDIDQREARKLRDDYFERFGGVKAFLDGVVAQAAKRGYTATLFDRRRYLPDLVSDNRQAREAAERAALNSPIQGTAADIIKVAMLRVDDALRSGDYRSRVLLQVHDELVVEVADGEEEAVTDLLHREMDAAITLRVPLEVSVGAGPNWDEAAH